MSRSATREYINDTLRIIGSDGLSGMIFKQEKVNEAFSFLQLQLTSPAPMSSQRLIAELRRQDLVIITQLSGVVKVQLSVKGVHRLQLAHLRSVTVPTPQQWDNIWRMVVFDIPARHADSRYLLTSELKRLGFVMLQNSMWLHPYPCFDQITQLLRYTNLQPFVTLAEISRIDSASLQRLAKYYPDLKKPSS